MVKDNAVATPRNKTDTRSSGDRQQVVAGEVLGADGTSQKQQGNEVLDKISLLRVRTRGL